MSDNFYDITSDIWESFWTYLPTLKLDVINERSLIGNTPSIPEIIWVKNVRAIVVCGFLIK